MTDQARRELWRYVIGAALSAVLTALAFWLVMGSDLPRDRTLWVIAICAVAQIAVQLRFFLPIGLRNQQREDLQLILFSLLLMAVMIGGMIWILTSLADRMH